MTAATLASLMMLAVAPAPDIRGTTSCPTPGEVLQHLRPLLPGRGGLPSSTWLRLVEPEAPAAPGAPAALEVRLARANQPDPIEVRRIARAGSCADTAEIIAVVLASWGSLFAPVPVATTTPASTPPATVIAARAPAAADDAAAGPSGIALGAAGGVAVASGAGAAP